MSKTSKKIPIRIYLDTCVILDYFIKERKNEISEFILRKLNGREYIGVISFFSILELKDNLYSNTDMIIKLKEGMSLYEIIQMRNERTITINERKKDDQDIIKFLEIHKRKIQLSVQEDRLLWENAMELMEIDNFSAPDALHVSSAILSKSHCFITKDKQLSVCLKNNQSTKKLLVLRYDKSTPTEDFISSFNNIEVKYKDLKLENEEKIAMNFFGNLISLIKPKDFDPKKYEKKVMSKKKK